VKTITVGQLRQNPTRMLDEVAAGESYTVTRHGHPVARIEPMWEPATPRIEYRPSRRPRGSFRLADLPPLKRVWTVEDVEAAFAWEREDR